MWKDWDKVHLLIYSRVACVSMNGVLVNTGLFNFVVFKGRGLLTKFLGTVYTIL